MIGVQTKGEVSLQIFIKNSAIEQIEIFSRRKSRAISSYASWAFNCGLWILGPSPRKTMVWFDFVKSI
jgi:hypothetical protein